MLNSQTISILKDLCVDETATVDVFYEALDKCNELKNNYFEYMTTQPVDCDTELQRLSTANYDLCCALITMLLREDHFSNGSFERSSAISFKLISRPKTIRVAPIFL